MPSDLSPAVTVAGKIVADPLGRIARYAVEHEKTVSNYDLGFSGDPGRLTAAEVARTRVIRSRIGGREGAQLVLACEQAGGALAAIPPTAQLRDADPAVLGGLYDQALAIFNGLLTPGIQYGKVSKVLHLKRPHLFPILDSRLRTVYHTMATHAAARYQVERPGSQRLYWAAIRDDVTADGNVAALAVLRQRLLEHDDERVQRTAKLSDVRLLDILAW